MMYLPQCMNCIHFMRFTAGRVGHCSAFPDGISADIIANVVDHRQQVAGDRGVRWSAVDPLVPHPLVPVEEEGVAP